jgi:hypothetical protein
MKRLASAILTVFLAACGTTATPSLPPTPTPPVDLLPADTFVIFNRAGGYAFTSKTLTVLLDGNARLEEGAEATAKEWMLSADQLASLKFAFDDPGFAESPFDTVVNCDDCYVVTINALTPQGPKAARVDSADIDFGNNVVVPPALKQAITLLNEIMMNAP